MPCNSEYLNATGNEIWLSRVYQLLDEVNTGNPVDPHKSDWRGYDPRAYNVHHTKEQKDELVDSLCTALSKMDVSKCSLEMQVWWRDHLRADFMRKAEEARVKKVLEIQSSALSKLTEEERERL